MYRAPYFLKLFDVMACVLFWDYWFWNLAGDRKQTFPLTTAVDIVHGMALVLTSWHTGCPSGMAHIRQRFLLLLLFMLKPTVIIFDIYSFIHMSVVEVLILVQVLQPW